MGDNNSEVQDVKKDMPNLDFKREEIIAQLGIKNIESLLTSGIAGNKLLSSEIEKAIERKISELPEIDELQNLNISYPDEMKIAIETLEERIKAEFFDYANGHISAAIESKANEIAINGKAQNLDANSVKNQLVDFKSSLDSIKKSQDYDCFVEAIKSFAAQSEIDIDLAELQEKLNFINLFRQIKSGSFDIQNFLQWVSKFIDRIEAKIIENPSQTTITETKETQRPGFQQVFAGQSTHFHHLRWKTKNHYNYYIIYDTFSRQVIKYTFTLTNDQKIEFEEAGEWVNGGTRSVYSHQNWWFA